MLNIHTITTTTSKLSSRLLAALVLAAVSLVLFAGPAHADKKGGTGPAAGCQIENDGKIETVPVGSKVGLFTCGSDGEWHFGWLINAISAPPKKTIKPLPTTVIHHGVLQAARAYRR
jgi:hypothetical protein